MHKNILRKQGQAWKQAEHKADLELADDIDAGLQEEAELQRISQARTKELKEKKKALQ
ncbi:hypothetical protein H0H81_004637, partial [Sphagnurus paluster]